jgi:cell division protein FtsA
MAKKTPLIVGLDIGSGSIKALAAAKKPEAAGWEILGRVELVSSGIRKGVIVNIDAVAQSVQEALNRLQEETGRRIEEVRTNIGGSHIFCTPSHGTVMVSRADNKISEEDKRRVIQAATFSLPLNREVIEVFAKEFVVDGHGQIKEPMDMRGSRLEVEVLNVCAFSPYKNNLINAVLHAGFQISDILPSALASAKALLTSQQKEIGVCLVDIGSATTDLAIFEEGDLVHTAVFPFGSANITGDIAVGLKIDVDVAEQIKREFGTCLSRGGEKKQKIEVPQESGEEETVVFSQKMLVGFIEPRVSEMFNLVQKEIKKVSLKSSLPGGVVLTGGGAKLQKIVELAKKELKLPVKIGVPRNWDGLERDPSWSTACGLITEIEGSEERISKPNMTQGLGTRIKKIFRTFAT